MGELDLNRENRNLRNEIEALRKEFLLLFSKHEHMISHEADHLEVLYLKKIGLGQYTLLCLQTEVAALRMKLQLAQAYINRGEKPNFKQINKEVADRLKEYYAQIKAQARALKVAEKSKTISGADIEEMKRLYRMLVRRLHPDLNPNQTEREADLFLKAQTAYKANNLEKLRKIVLALDLNEEVDLSGTISDLEAQKIRLETQIDELRTQIEALEKEFPFNFRKKLYDREWLANQKAENEALVKQLTEEKAKLERYLDVIKEI